MSNTSGTIYIVSTPIGNLGDMSARAIEVLKSVDLVLAEDTRHSRPLLQNFGITTHCIAFHEHNERDKADEICQQVLQGKSVALISDAGTPLVSDPGFHLTRRAHELGVSVSPIPGVTAAMAALSASGLPSDRFVFEGFLSPKQKARTDKLKSLSRESRTLIFYESPRRVLETLQDMVVAFGADRQIVLARELTKMHETIVSKPLSDMLEFVEQDANQQRGEIVLVVAGAPEVETDMVEQDVESILSVLIEELPQKQAAAIAAKLTGRKKNEMYALALKLKE